MANCACGGAVVRMGLTTYCASCGTIHAAQRAAPKEERNNAPYKRWRAKVRHRDGHRCRFRGCGSTDRLETHHIRRWADDPKLRYDPANGITLCFHCHHAIQDREEEHAEELAATARALATVDPKLQSIAAKIYNRQPNGVSRPGEPKRPTDTR